LRFVEPIAQRIRELQQEQKDKLQARDRYTRNAIADRMALASRIAEEDRNPNALFGAEQAIARLFGLVTGEGNNENATDFTTARNMQDVGKKLLQSVGFREPDELSIQAAIEANDEFIDALQAIHKQAQALSIEAQ